MHRKSTLNSSFHSSVINKQGNTLICHFCSYESVSWISGKAIVGWKLLVTCEITLSIILVMSPVSSSGSWQALTTSVHSYLSGVDSQSSFLWDVMWCHLLEEWRPPLHHCESLKISMEEIHLTHDRNQLWIVMNTIMSFQIAWNVKNFLSSWANISLSRTAP